MVDQRTHAVAGAGRGAESRSQRGAATWRRKACVLAVAAAGALAVQAAAGAEDPQALGELSLEQLMDLSVEKVYGASKFEQKLTAAPASVSVVTADEIRRLGHRSLADVLRSIRGLYVADDRNYAYLGVRGFLRPGDYNSRVLMLIDGHRVNDDIYDSIYLGQDNVIDVDLIERVEFIRGPSSSIYGGSAFFGVINIITRRGSQLNGAELALEGGSFDTYKAGLSYGKLFGNGLEVMLSSSYYDSQGQSQLYFPEFDQRSSSAAGASNNGVASNADREDSFKFFGSLRYRELSFSAAASTRTKKIPTASYGTVFNDGREKTEDNHAYLDLQYDHRINTDLQMLGRVFYDRYSYYGDYPYQADPASIGDPPSVVIFKDGAQGEWLGTELQLTQKLFDRHTLVGGFEYRENLRVDQDYYSDTTPRVYTLNDRRRSRILGVFSQGDFALLPRLRLNAGLRYDYYPQGFGGTLNPRVGLIYNPWQQTTLKALYGQAFRPPNAYESYYGAAQQTQPPLKPEKIRTYELVLEQALGRKTRFDLSAYRYDVTDLISEVALSNADIYYANLNRARTYGLEAEVERKTDSGFEARLSYALQRAEDSSSGQVLSNSPRHLAKLSLIAPLYRKQLFAGFELQYEGSVRTLADASAHDFVLGNFTLSGEHLIKGLDLSAGVYNLFDTRYGYPGAQEHVQDVIEQDGRSFRVRLGYRF